jgi:cytochrome c
VKKLALILFIVCLAGTLSLTAASSGESESGKAIFEKRGCAACHDPTKDQSVLGLGPSLEQIAEAYKGHEGDLTKFLKCESKPLVDEARFSTMHGQIVKMKDMSDSEMKALEKFILDYSSHRLSMSEPERPVSSGLYHDVRIWNRFSRQLHNGRLGGSAF